MNLKSILQTAIALSAVSVGSAAYAQETIRLTVLAGLPPTHTGVSVVLNTFIPEVDRILAESGEYKIDWTEAVGGTVAKQPAIFEAIEDGIGDIGYVNTLFEGDKLPLEQITYVTPFGSTDVQDVVKIMTQLRSQVPEMNEAFEDHNQLHLASVCVDNYQLITKDPVRSLSELQGLKIGVPGLSANWIKDTGAVPVSGSLSEYYNAIRTGVYDGIVVFESAIGPFRFHEVAPAIGKVDFGATYASALTINKGRFEKLPAPVQEAIVSASKVFEVKVNEYYATRGANSVNTALEGGAAIYEWPQSERVALVNAIPNFAKVWAADADSKGLPGTKVLNAYMSLSRDAGVEHMRKWDEE